MDKLLSVEFLRFFLPLIGAVVAWFWNEERKRADEEYVRKEKNYNVLVECLNSFYAGASSEAGSIQLRERFLVELNRAWLYCPDEVIRKAYRFLETVHTQKISSDEEKELALGEFVLAIRNDLISHKRTRSTELTATDFKHLKANWPVG